MKKDLFSRLFQASLMLTVATTALTACSSGGGASNNTPVTTAPKVPADVPVANGKATAPLALPDLNDQQVPSVDRMTLNNVMARAEKENKVVAMEVGAAWCGPCTSFAFDIEKHPETLTSLTAANIILVKAENEKATNTDLSDFIPSLTKYFPSFYLYTPGKGWKSLPPVTSVKDLLMTVSTLGQTGAPSAAAVQKFFTPDQGAAAGTLPAAVDANTAAIFYTGFSSVYSYDDAKTILNLFQANEAVYPNHNLEYYATSNSQTYVPDYLAAGAVTYETVAKDFPMVFTHLTDASNDEFSNRVTQNQMAIVARASGYKAALAQCAPAWASNRAHIVQGALSADDFAKKMTSLDFAAQLLCAELELRANGPTDALKAKVAAFDQTKMSSWGLLGATGNIESAIAAYQKRYKMFADSYASELASDATELQKATDAKDQKKIDELNADIEITKFQQANHANVDTEVEDGIKATRYVPVLHVLN